MIIETGSRVRLEYEIKTTTGELIESSAKHGPIEYIQGEGKLLPGLEKRLLGARAGVEIKGEIPAGEVFGSEEGFPTKHLAPGELPKDAKVGSMLEAKTATGETVVLKIIETNDKGATARLLPPIALKDLTFRAKVLMIEDPKSGKREVVERKPPPPPAAALKVDVEDGE